MFDFNSIRIDCRAYCLITGLVALSLVSAVVALNYIVDPYLIHQWDTKLINRISPRNQKITPWAKTYAAYRYQPDVVYLGSSRTEIGLPPQTQLFENNRVLNLSLSGGTPGDAIDILYHSSNFHRPQIVVWGLEYGWLFADAFGNTDFDRSLVARNSWYPLWRFLLNIKRCLSMNMVKDTFKILTGTADRDCPSILATYGQESELCVARNMHVEGNTAQAFAKAIRNDSHAFTPGFAVVMGQIDRATEDLCNYGTTLRIFIQPNHALSELQFLPHWKDRENWERALVKVTDKRREQGCNIRLIDFSGFNSITTEEIPQKTGKETMQYYWEQSHYRSAVGKRILEKLFTLGPQSEPDDFGVELNGEVIERHLENVRTSRDLYLKSHPDETKHF